MCTAVLLFLDHPFLQLRGWIEKLEIAQFTKNYLTVL